MIAASSLPRRGAAAPRLAALLLAGAALGGAAGCGGMSQSYRATAVEPERAAAVQPERATTVEPERESPAELESEQVALDEQLSEILARPEPDCERACELGDAICDLNARICAIADRHPGDEATAGRCADGAARCEAARERIAARCACPPG